MRTPLAGKLLGVAAGIAILSACSGGSQSAGTSPGMMPNTSHATNNTVRGKVSPTAYQGAIHVHRLTGKSWSKVSRAGTGNSLLYITNVGTGTVSFYTYNNGAGLTQQGSLTGFSYPGQPCADSKGNVFIPDYSLGTVTEFAHGGTSALQTLTAPAAISCSIDPKTGNLAVADFGYSEVSIFAGATGTPTTYTWSETPYPEYVAYDNNSNLFIEGNYNGAGALGELPSGSSTIENLTLSGFSVTFPGPIQWGGTYLLVGDQGTFSVTPSSVNQTTVSGTTVTFKANLPFPGSKDITGYFKRGDKKNGHIVGADYGNGTDAQVDTFPGMSPVNTITTGISLPFGVVISQ